MAEILEDGTGDGFKMKIDKSKRAHVQSLAIPYDVFTVLAEDSFAVTSPVINLTSANTSYLLYISNDNSHDIVLSTIRGYFGETDGTGTDSILELYLQPTGGTLISGGTPSGAINNNLGSPEVLEITATTGVEASTATGGFPVPTIQQAATVFDFTQAVVIPPSTTFALGVKPPTGNTDMNVVLTVTLIKQTIDIG
jgi:hypothetical protein